MIKNTPARRVRLIALLCVTGFAGIFFIWLLFNAAFAQQPAADGIIGLYVPMGIAYGNR